MWNRAAMEGGGPEPREGDTALTDLLRFHSVSLNGGLLNGYETRTREEVSAAIRGYRYFGLDKAASTVEWLASAASATDLENDLEAAERLELEADACYAEAVPTDAVLLAAFGERFRREPDTFAPVNE